MYREMNEKYPSLLASFDLPLLENQSSVDITAGSPWRYAFIPAIPTILPLYLLLILSVLGIQGINSRRRVAAILSDPEKLITLQSEPPSAELLVNFLDVMNIPTEPEFHYTAIEPSKPLALESKPLPFNDATQRIYDNLSQVKWERFWVYIKSISAHGCIICREKRFYHDGGKATVQHFIDTTFLN
jgi:hypothetical protein